MIAAYAFISFFGLVSYVNEKTIIAQDSIYEKTTAFDGDGLKAPVQPIAFTNNYVKFSRLYLGQETVNPAKTYVIENAVDLYYFSLKSKEEPQTYLNLNYVLGKDIDYNEASTQGLFFIPVGFNTPFNGTFDGQGFEITNLFFSPIIQESVYINEYDETLVHYSMFSNVGATGQVVNLGLKNVWMYQPIAWGQMIYASTMIGKNDGLVSHVYYIDDRLEPGLNVDGDFEVSGLISINNGIFKEAFVSLVTVLSDASTSTINHTPVINTNNGQSLENVYYDQQKYTKNKLTTDLSVGLTTAQFQESNRFDSKWYFNNSYSSSNPQALRTLIYPTLKGLKKDLNGNLLISNARDLVVMSQLLNETNYFRNQNYRINNDINYDSVSKDAYITPKFGFSGSLESLPISNPSQTTLYTRNFTVGASNYYSILNLELNKEVMINNLVTYGLFGVLFGRVANLNVIDMKMGITNITTHSERPEVSVGSIAGYLSGGTIENVHVYSGIEIADGTNPKTYVGGLVGKGFGVINETSFNGFIDTGVHTYRSNVSESAVGGLIGFAEGISVIKSTNKAPITGFSYLTTNQSSISYVGGIVGYGHINQMNQVINLGQIQTYNQNHAHTSIYAAGIIGNVLSVGGELNHLTNKGNLNFHYQSTTSSRISGVLNLHLVNDFVMHGLTNDAFINITYPTFTNANLNTIVSNGSLEVAGSVFAYGSTGSFYGLYNNKNFEMNLSLFNRYAGVLLANNDFVSTGNYNNLGVTNASSSYIKVFQAYNKGNISVTSSNTIYHNWVKISGVVVGKNMDYEQLRNTGSISINLENEMPNALLYLPSGSIDGLANPQKTFKVNGVFEEVSQNRTARNIYNGGRLSFYNANTNLVANLFISGIGYKNANTNLYQQKGIDYTSVDFSPVEGSIHNAVNDGEIYVDARIKGQSRMAGIVLINESMLTGVANTGDIYNSNAIQSSSGTGVSWEFEVETGGITFLMATRYAQIRDSVNYGNIVSYSSTTNGWVNASGIATRNDKNEYNVDAGSQNNFQYFAKIAFSINYGDVIAYNARNSDGLNIANETHNKSSGILSLGLLSSVNNLNYGNIYGKNLGSGIYGFVFVDKFVKYGTVNNNEIFISNSINYGNVRRITSANAFVYNGINQGISINNSFVVTSNLSTNANAFGGLIAKIHTGSNNNWNYSTGNFSIARVTFSYLVNFDSVVNVLGNAPTITGSNQTIINQVSGNMATTKADDTSKEPFNLIKSYSLDAAAPTGQSGLDNTTFSGIFHTSFPLRTAPAVNNFMTDQYISNFIQFIPKSKVSAPLLNKIGFQNINQTAGIYALSSTEGIGNGLFMPDNIDLNALNPITYVDGVAMSDQTWQDEIVSRGQTIYYKFFSGMKQLEKAIATTIFDLELYKEDDPSVTLGEPEIDNVNGTITYYVASNSDAAYDTQLQTVVTDSYVPINQQTANTSIATWVPNSYGSNTGTWVGHYYFDQASGNYVYDTNRLYNTTDGTHNVTFTSNNQSYEDGNPTYNRYAFNRSGTSYELFQVRASGNGRRVTSATNVGAGYGAYRQLQGSYQGECIRTFLWFCLEYETVTYNYYEYAGPNQEVTYQRITTTMTEYTPSSNFAINYNDESTYELAYGASLKFNGQPHSGNDKATILTTYGPYNIDGEHSASPGLDSYQEHYGTVRVYSESFTGDQSDFDYDVTYRDYKILIKRTNDQSLSSITNVQVDGVNTTFSGSNPTNVTLNTQVNYQATNNPSVSFRYNTVNLKNTYDLLDQIKLYDANDVLIDSSLYRVEGGIVSAPGGFNNANASYANGTLDIRVYLDDELDSGNYKLVTSLSVLAANQQDYVVNFTKRLSSEKLIKSITYGGITYEITNNQTLTTTIPYGIYFDASNPETFIVDFSSMGNTENPSYINGLTLSYKATIVSVVLQTPVVFNTTTNQHRYTIVYTIRAEDNSTTTFTHRLEEAAPQPNIIKSFKNGDASTGLLSEFNVLRQEIANIRVEYNLLNAFVNDDNFTISSTYQGPEPQTAVLGLNYFINRIDEVGFEVDFNQSASIGDYVFSVSYMQQVNVAGYNLTWNYQAYEDFTVRKLKSDDSLISNVTFISDTVYAGLNIIMDYEYISTTDYVAYLDNPASRTIVTLPSTGINYNAYDDYNAYYIIGQVQMSDLSFYNPTFYLPFGSIIRRITDIDNAANPELQSELLSTDFSPGDDDSVFNFIQYRVYAEDYDQFDANYNTHYTDYFVAVQDITNNVYFDLTIRYDQNIVNFSLEKVFVTFDLFQSGTKKTSMSLFSHFSGSNVGSNLQFRSSMSGNYKVSIDLPEGFTFVIQFESSSINVSEDTFNIPSDIIPRKYALTITVVRTNQTPPWGQQEIVDYNPTT
jgi:hypothetical protein